MSFDRHPYLKHSTAAPYMPAHKDTQHPTGQIVNQDAGQRTLSDYVRSINRAQAFDDVAAEGKLTFEEWYKDAKTRWALIFEAQPHALEIVWLEALKHGKVS